MSIDQLKATISKKGGLSQANRFNVMFTPPQGSLLNSDPATLIGGLVSGGGLSNVINDPRDISLLAESVNLPSSQITTLDHIAEKQTVKIPYAVIQEEVTMTFLLTNDYYIKNMFDKWGQSIVDLETYRVAYKKRYCYRCCNTATEQTEHSYLWSEVGKCISNNNWRYRSFK